MRYLIIFWKNLKNFWHRLTSGRERKTMFALSLVLICIFFAAGGQIVMKSGMSQVGEIGSLGQLLNLGTLSRIFINPRILIGLFCYGVSAILWLGALSTLNVSFMYPLLSLSYIITAIVASIFLREEMTLLRWVGIFVVVGGCFLITRTG
jgi:drug/metabolite transporter (DMT)-like permease